MNDYHEHTTGARHVGRRMLIHDSIDSTNTRCADFADDAAHDGLVIVTASQTAGRGQHGRTWLAESGSSILMSVLLFPPLLSRRPVLLTAWVAVSVCELIEELTDLQPRIKWPNDVLCGGQKVCGILIEQKGGVIAGLGLNLNQTAESFVAAGLPDAASLAMLTGCDFAREQATERLLGLLDKNYQQLLQGTWSKLESAWRERLGLAGRKVYVAAGGSFREGWIREVSFDALILELSDGEISRLAPEAVQRIELT